MFLVNVRSRIWINVYIQYTMTFLPKSTAWYSASCCETEVVLPASRNLKHLYKTT